MSETKLDTEVWNDHKEACGVIDWYLLRMKNQDLEIVFLKYIRKHCLVRIKQIKPKSCQSEAEAAYKKLDQASSQGHKQTPLEANISYISACAQAQAPKCPKCSSPMVHVNRDKSSGGSFYQCPKCGHKRETGEDLGER
jgi:predicted RNA-binding Zn-ribbon protein involved in translation (DUF1610 family)